MVIPRQDSRIDACLHESAHGVVRQLLIGDLGQMGFKKRAAYSYPVERKPFNEMDRHRLSKIAVVIAAGIVAEERLCGGSGVGDYAISDDTRQLGVIQRIAGFTDDEMEGFNAEARRLVESYETAIRKVAKELNRQNRLSGEKVTPLIEQNPPDS